MIRNLAVTWMLAGAAAGPGVTLTFDDKVAVLDNGLVTAAIERRTGNLISLKREGLDLLAGGKGYWSYVGSTPAEANVGRFGSRTSFSVRTDPSKNGGERAEIFCRLESGEPGRDAPVDVDLRYSLGRGDTGLYAYAVWEHKAGHPALRMAEARFCLKLNPDVFDFLSVDDRRHRRMASGADWDRGTETNLKEARRLTTGPRRSEVEHKYDYSAVLAQTGTWGWCGTQRKVGLWMINPSFEYVIGGPTKVELTGHLDGNKGGLPTLLNMWQGAHYGGRPVVLAEGEAWTKIVGPFLLHCNSGSDPDGLRQEALAKARAERSAWPYEWVREPLYPPAAGRGRVAGKIALSDPQAPGVNLKNAWVGLAASVDEIDWQLDGKHYQHWVPAKEDGRFEIPHARPGTYVLHAFSDGVLGEFSKDGVAVQAGRALDLGTLTWTPIRHGRTVWEIGVPDRTATEFRHGDHYWQWGLYLKYPEEFPGDVRFVVGRSDPSRDWNYCQPPRIDADGKSSDTTWTIEFDLAEVKPGTAALRMAICGSRGRGRVAVSVNDTSVGDTGDLPESGVMHRDGIRGYWFEKTFTFDAALLKPGKNLIRLRSRGDNWTKGILYDYLRLEAP
jgi:rhamnogalacturonan endolyase